ncbi:patatin-like phospholipase family protein [Neoroseomonas oryzicola]|uniref:Patatin-like phospholipase family protein n=1 Tax=Neoroseomonas oryzicola TaxID=535904 RepID=A0A9X9WEH6_9PROT|nr:patatin-like phospholipase family protein [Neoroseomonas oryzicola]MBR0658736.1 patatin-like phospholipase family protein [Neoroseomonas oryzicola]NKE17828.1 patatin-like phospholipase family protein [Neoroseomonas oryzicola]
MTQPPLVAIACQGGGSHAAFTAGALHALFGPHHAERFTLRGLSGTSGGAVCAALAWAGLLTGGFADARRRLEAFWTQVAASDPIERVVNDWSLAFARLPVTAQVSPYAYCALAEPRLRDLLGEHLRLEALPAGRAGPALRIAAANVLTGEAGIFRGEELTLDDVVASAAVPPIFRAVRTRGGLWWDGMFSQNPPLRDLLDLDPKPRELWVIRLNPRRRASEPTTVAEIDDRRNEMAGNVPLDQEIDMIRRFNRLRLTSPEVAQRYAAITVREIELDLQLDYQSKLDRSPELLERLRAHGAHRAAHFFEPQSVTVHPDGRTA